MKKLDIEPLKGEVQGLTDEGDVQGFVIGDCMHDCSWMTFWSRYLGCSGAYWNSYWSTRN